MTGSTRCEEVRLGAPELALGVLVGAERADMLAHLELCAACRSEVRSLAEATDAVLDLAPVADPPVGFEVRLLARRAAREAATARPRPQRLTRAVALAAAVVLVIAGLGIGVVVGRSRTGGTPGVRVAALEMDGASRGGVVVASGHPAWLVMTVEMTHRSGWVRCVVSEDGGREVTVGRLWLNGGYGGWSAPLNVPASEVRSARLELADGTTLATAILPAE